MSENPDCIYMVAQERFKDLQKTADHVRLANSCDKSSSRNILKHVVCLAAKRMIAIGTYLLARYGELPETGFADRPLIRHRRAT